MAVMSESLIQFLRARLDDDDRVARAAKEDASGVWRPGDGGMVEYGEGPNDWPGRSANGTVVYGEGSPTVEEAEHIARWDPARVLAEVDAKRRFLDWIGDMPGGDPWQEGRYAVELLRLLALPHTDHPDYREEWRP